MSMFTLCCKLESSLAKFSWRVTKRLVHSEYKIHVNGLDLNIVETGKGNKSVLLMPGTLGSCWTDFEPQLKELPKLLPNHKIIAWDPPGFGKSIPPKRQWCLDIFHYDAHFAFELMKTLGRPKFSIVGWSGGGVSGLIVAGLYRDNIEKLITWGAGAFITAEEVQHFQSIRDVRKWSAGMREPMEKLYGVERFAELWSEWVDAISAIHQKRNGNFCRAEVKLIKAPTFVLRGKKDPVIASQPIEYVRKCLKNVRAKALCDSCKIQRLTKHRWLPLDIFCYRRSCVVL